MAKTVGPADLSDEITLCPIFFSFLSVQLSDANFEARKIEKKEVDYNPEFVTRMIPKLDWSAFRQAAGQVECEEDLPEELAQNYGEDEQLLKKIHHIHVECEEGLPEELAQNYGEDEQLLKKIHHILLEVEVIEGDLVCPESGRKFPVTNGIPNMMLKEDEA